MNIYMIFDNKDNSFIDFPFAQFEKSITGFTISAWDRISVMERHEGDLASGDYLPYCNYSIGLTYLI